MGDEEVTSFPSLTAAVPVKTPKKKAAGASKAKKPADHPTYASMVKDAITALKERGGSSRQAILKYIVKHNKVGQDEKAVNAHLKVALRSGIKSGSLKQSKGVGASGSFRLGEKKEVKVEKLKTKASAQSKVKKTAGSPKKSASSPKKAKAAGSAKKAKAAGSPKKAKAAGSPKKGKAASSPKKAAKPKSKKASGDAKKPKTPKKAASPKAAKKSKAVTAKPKTPKVSKPKVATSAKPKKAAAKK